MLDPRDSGSSSAPARPPREGSTGARPQENAAVTRAILAGEHAPADVPAGEELALINAGAAIYAAGRRGHDRRGRAGRARGARRRKRRERARALRAGEPQARAGRGRRDESRARRHGARPDPRRNARGGRAAQARAAARCRVSDRRAWGGRRSAASATRCAAPGIGVIAEFKRRSPSAGALHEAPDLAAIVSAYERGGRGRAVGPHRGPQLRRLAGGPARGARGCELPLLRKDFIVDPYQLHEARAAGADAVLLIVAALDGRRARGRCTAQARALGLDVLVEVHDGDELERALDARSGDRRHQQPRPARLQRGPRAHRAC